MTELNREELAKLVQRARPALASLDFIPALKCFYFGQGFLSAYNDISAIRVRLPTKDLQFGVCVPGELFVKALGSFSANNVLLQLTDSTLLVSSGRAKVKLPCLPADKWPLKMPKGDAPKIEVSTAMLDGIAKCLPGSGNDPTRASTQGVTLDVIDGKAVLFSTDNRTISRFATHTGVALPGDAPVILPTFFCEQLLALSKGLDTELYLYAGALVACFFDKQGDEVATLMTKMLVDVQPLDFDAVIAKHCNLAQLRPIKMPDSLDSAIGRAVLMQESEAIMTKVTADGENLRLQTQSPLGESTDSMACSAESPTASFNINPTLVERGLKNCTHFALPDKVVMLCTEDKSFVHIIAHMSA